MRWDRGQGGDQVIDRRGGGARIGAGAGGLGVVGVLIALVVNFLGGGGGGGFQLPTDLGIGTRGRGGFEASTATDDQTQFIQFVIDNVQDAWEFSFASSGQTYERTKVVLFDGGVQTGCGAADSSVGPFYCPADRLIYIDLGFFRDLAGRFGVEGSDAEAGSFAQAYVIAHEVGHHLQTILGIGDEVRQKERDDPDRANDLSIRQELQADCFAGVWGHSAFAEGRLDDADIAQGLDAAAAVGDDRIQAQAGAGVNSETWTHGSAEQRTRWFRVGFDSGQAGSCDTFGAAAL
ncbi:MAG: KPN_02809 family neutral zinc metallopeptidase [Acidimicrobiia bacterium]